MFDNNDPTNQANAGFGGTVTAPVSSSPFTPVAATAPAHTEPPAPVGAPILPTTDPTHPAAPAPASTAFTASSLDEPTDKPSAPAVTPPALSSADDNGDLAGMKQEALTHLQPLVDHLEQSPEDQFKTTMMMIQATDDQRLLKKAFESAKKITDDKARAQALLDVINEINYFTTQNQKSAA